MDIVTVDGKQFVKKVTYDLSAVPMTDMPAIQKHLDEGFQPFSSLTILRQPPVDKIVDIRTGQPQMIQENLVFFRRANYQLSELKIGHAPIVPNEPEARN